MNVDSQMVSPEISEPNPAATPFDPIVRSQFACPACRGDLRPEEVRALGLRRLRPRLSHCGRDSGVDCGESESSNRETPSTRYDFRAWKCRGDNVRRSSVSREKPRSGMSSDHKVSQDAPWPCCQKRTGADGHIRDTLFPPPARSLRPNSSRTTIPLSAKN